MTRVYLAAYRDGMSTRYQEVGPEDMGAEAFVPEGAVVRVKPLQWSDRGYDWSWWATNTPLDYRIRQYTPDEFWVDFDGETIEKDAPQPSFDAAVALANRDFEARIRAALDLTTEPEPTSGWRDDPESSDAWCAGNYYALTRLCKVLGVDPGNVSWDGSDGSLDEEADALIWRILNAKEVQEPTSGAYEMICLTAEDVVQGRGFTGDAAADLATAQESLRACLALLGWRG